MSVRSKDGHPAAMIKPGVLSRSGVFPYTYDEMVARGFTPKVKKDWYTEYRSPAVVVASKDKYPYVTMTLDHTDEETNPRNFHDPNQKVEGIVGKPVEVTTLADGNIALNGEFVFYTQEGVNFYNAGNKETSGDLKSKVRESLDPRYDFECLEILSVNGVVLTARGRGGPGVRVQDRMPAGPKENGGLKMKKGILSMWLGTGRTKDGDNFKLSSVLIEEVKKVSALTIRDEASVTPHITRVLDHIKGLGDNEIREYLIGAVAESFQRPIEVLANEVKLSAKVDELYTRCRTLDAEAMSKVLDASPEEEEEEDEVDEKGKKTGKKVPKKKETPSKDGAPVDYEKLTATIIGQVKDAIPAAVNAAINARLGAVETTEQKAAREKLEKETGRTTDALQQAVDAALRKQLGLPEEGTKTTVSTEGRSQDSYEGGDEDGAFILNGAFGG